MSQQLLTTEHTILITQEKQQQAILARREIHVGPVKFDAVVNGVDPNTARADDFPVRAEFWTGGRDSLGSLTHSIAELSEFASDAFARYRVCFNYNY